MSFFWYVMSIECSEMWNESSVDPGLCDTNCNSHFKTFDSYIHEASDAGSLNS